jgi:electron transport complex protein RnfG
MLKSIFSKAWMAALACLGLLLAQPGSARAEVFFTVRDLLAQQFKQSERVTFVHARPTPEQRQHLEQRLGERLSKGDYVFYVATTGSHVDGYALFDEERGQHELINFGTFFDAEGRVTRVEVMAYREPYGDGIRAERFRKQFIGRTARSAFAPDKGIDAVSGATISSHSMCAGVQRASVLLDEMLLRGSPQLASR